MKEMINFDMPKNQSSIIKVIGIGGGGSNAVNHMFRQGIKGVDFIICNTDMQAMESSPIPTKIQLGEKGLGAGSIPSVGKEAALKKVEQIKAILEKNTQMLFITAGMGGGTGTGAAPVVASIAKELGILTVGIVTVPFTFEGKKRKIQADEGIDELKNYVDTLLIICNDKLRDLGRDLKLSEAFAKADDVLATAARGIAEIITVTGHINVDFEDVRTVMKDGGKAIMGYARAEGENRALEAVKSALSSPLLNDNDIEGASNVLLYITSGQEEISMDEVAEITEYIQQEAKSQAEIIWGNGYDESLADNISITLIATGFEAYKKNAGQDVRIRHELHSEASRDFPTFSQPADKEPEKVPEPIEMIRKYTHEGEAKDPIKFTRNSEPDKTGPSWNQEEFEPEEIRQDDPPEDKEKQRTFVFEFEREDDENKYEEDNESIPDMESRYPDANNPDQPAEQGKKQEEIKPFEVYIKKPGGDTPTDKDNPDRPSIDLRSQERIERLRNLSLKLKSESTIEELENEPAYIRRKVELKDSIPSSEGQISRYSLYEDPESKNPELRTGNSYLHDNVD